MATKDIPTIDGIWIVQTRANKSEALEGNLIVESLPSPVLGSISDVVPDIVDSITASVLGSYFQLIFRNGFWTFIFRTRFWGSKN